MRIDDENKVVWCSDELIDWKNSFYQSCDPVINMMYSISRVGFGWRLTDFRDNEVDYKYWDKGKKKELVLAVLNNYEFKLEQPQKYYWRKKKEYLASFEDEQYLFADEHEKTTVTSIAYASKFDETELMNVIGSVDFDKFEKVECE
ncbi:hypothetical protein [uncultured Vagococcus sp.]|uniref:hypothetical protein n=1 Tax=uncultured Vagococcus sp. TaxID=189676 RepID=UPI00258D1D31|nr:hypothetical protein [uncultured Vagococcus sp.]